jgi:1-acyl-sn-glycerol-3-phosphate acyltransferase
MLQFIRSILFHFSFISFTFIFSVCFLWCLLLPRPKAMPFIRLYFRGLVLIEWLTLGLHYKVEGSENLPKDGKFILASKHQCAYETYLYPIILDDPAIILKKELLRIPLWGWYARKSEVISVDRSAFTKALKSMADGAKRCFEQGRPVLIFPQGTRTLPHETTAEKPYKTGIARIYNELQCPVVPVALNTGFFWGRKSFIKRSGTATLKILPPIEAGLENQALLKRLEEVIEPESKALFEQAQEEHDKKSMQRLIGDALTLGYTAFIICGFYWVWCANAVEDSIARFQQELTQSAFKLEYESIEKHGFPLYFDMRIHDIAITSPLHHINIPLIEASATPFPSADIHLQTVGTTKLLAATVQQDINLDIDSFSMVLGNAVPWPFQKIDQLDIRDLDMSVHGMDISLFGRLIQLPYEEGAAKTNTVPLDGVLYLSVRGYRPFLEERLELQGVERSGLFFVLGMLERESQSHLNVLRQQSAYFERIPEDALFVPISIDRGKLTTGMSIIDALLQNTN